MKEAILSLALLSLPILTGSSPGQTKAQVVVTAESERMSFVRGADLSFRFSITNNWKHHTISFLTCPPPYDVKLMDSQGRSVPFSDSYQRTLKQGGYVCESTVMIEIRPGETWGPALWPTPDRGMFDLQPGGYTGRLKWHFAAYKDVAGGAQHTKSMAVPSNTFSFVVVHQP